MLSRIIGTIISPVAKLVRYAALKIMKRLRQPDDGRPLQATAEHMLDEIVLPSGFRIFRNAKFREAARFRRQPVVEHDRIFNEINVAGVCVLLFYLNSIKTMVRPEDYHFWQGVGQRVPRQFTKILINFGVDSGNTKIYRELIEIRYNEYKRLTDDVWKENRITGQTDFRELPEEMQYIAAAIRATAIGTADHIKRGKLERGDPLLDILMEWLLGLRRRIFKFVKRL